MLTFSLILTGVLGMLQEITYKKYGPHWKEGLFYTVSFLCYCAFQSTYIVRSTKHSLSLPVFIFMIPHVQYGFWSLSSSTTKFSPSSLENADPAFQALSSILPSSLTSFSPYILLAVNLVTQLICVSGVNQLSSVSVLPEPFMHSYLNVSSFPQHVSSVSTNLVLTTRKALSLCFSVWWFGNGWNTELGVGASMVFLGSLLYTFVSSSSAGASKTSTAVPNGVRGRGKKKPLKRE